MTKYSPWQRLRIRFWGKIRVGERIYPDGSEPIMFYAFNCPIHGIVEDYAHGFGKRLLCPKCLETRYEQ